MMERPGSSTMSIGWNPKHPAAKMARKNEHAAVETGADDGVSMEKR